MSERISKIKETYSAQLQERLEQEKVEISLNSAWDTIVSADPTKNNKNVRWLVETYINNGYLWEDIASGATSKVSETLVEFNKHKRKLDTSERSLMKYQSLGSLWSAIKPYAGQLTPGEEKKEERERAYAEAEVIIDREDGLKVIVPQTEYAAKWLGRGTRWCTASDNNNMFNHYYQDAPLFIVLMPNGDKLQLWKTKDSIQFMDENDEHITRDYMDQYRDILSELTLFMECFRYYTEDKITYDMCVEAVNKNPYNIKYIPEEYRDYNLYLTAVKNSGTVLKDVPEEYIDKHMCVAAMDQIKWAFRFLPDKYKDYDLCLNAVRDSGQALNDIPEEKKDYNLCLEAVRSFGLALDIVPKKYVDDNMRLNAVRQNGDALQFIPEEYRDYNMCLEAVQSYGGALFWIKNAKYLDYNLCLEAVKRSGIALKYTPERFITEELCLEAIKNSGWSLKDVPEKYITRELCKLAISNNSLALAYVPDEYKDEEICMEALNRNYRSLEHFPETYNRKALWLQMIKENSNTFKSIPEAFIDYDLSIEALRQNPDLWEYIPEQIQDILITKNLKPEVIVDVNYATHQEQISQLKEIFQKQT